MDIEEALKWADVFGAMQSEPPDGDAHALLALAAEVRMLRAALERCEHQTHSLRVWNGHGWLYHPPQAGRIAEICKARGMTPNVEDHRPVPRSGASVG